jgi:hypothetical protein
MLRSAFLYLADQQQIFVRSVGEELLPTGSLLGKLDSAPHGRRRLTRAAHCVLDLAGESVHMRPRPGCGRRYITMLDRIHEQKADANVSVKLTAMGLDTPRISDRDHAQILVRA